MKLLFHAGIIASVFIGGDLYVNGGSETGKLLRHLSFQSTVQQGKLTAHQVTSTIGASVRSGRPQLAAID